MSTIKKQEENALHRVFIKAALFVLMLFFLQENAVAYPIDGFTQSGIRRLVRLQLILKGEIKDTKPIEGATLGINDIKLQLLNTAYDGQVVLPETDAELQKKLAGLFPNLHESYSVALLDITPGKKIRYANRQETRGFQPGSVGKLAVLAGLFNELQRMYPNSFEMRQNLLKSKFVRGGRWAMHDSHTVPFFDPETRVLVKRTVREDDVFSLYEWTDHMISVSNNGAASVLWRELVLMRKFGIDYPGLTEQQATDFFKNTPKSELLSMAIAVVNEPLLNIGITKEEWRLGSFFTQGAKSFIPGSGGSTGTPVGLMKFLVAMEKGKMIDEKSSLEMKRLMYATDRRIRYGTSPRLTNAALYFKSGSLYKCKPEEGYECKKYAGNVENYMNSVAIVEHKDGTVYMVVLMSNVLRKNSNIDHQTLATRIDDIVRK